MKEFLTVVIKYICAFRVNSEITFELFISYRDR